MPCSTSIGQILPPPHNNTQYYIPMAYTLNPQQQAVIDWAKTSYGSANVNALAGTGKTSTLAELPKHIQGRSLFCAFNKAIAEEIKARLAPYPFCEGATLHATGLKLFRQLRRGFDIEERKVRYITRDKLPYMKKPVDVVCDAVNSAKQRGVGIPGYPHWNDEQTWVDIFEDEELGDELPQDFSLQRAYDTAKTVYAKSMALCEERAAVIDFNDMILAPLVMGGEGPWMQSYDWVLVDEAQDLNETRRLLAARVLKTSGRFVAVGDKNQAIYAFAGANTNSMELVQKRFNSIELPLSVTYRCPTSVVSLAQQWVPHYEAAETNGTGVIRNINHNSLWKEQFSPDDVILCRNTRPLVGIAKRLRKAGVPCLVEGYSPKGLIALAEKWGDITIRAYTARLQDYMFTEVAKLENKNKEEKAEKLREKCMVMLDLCEDLEGDDGTYRLVKHIEKMFGQGTGADATDVLHLCTIHRSKGREWGRVYLVGRNSYQPSPYAKKPEELQQEDNLQYVAVTRTKEELVEVDVPAKKKKKAGVGGGWRDGDGDNTEWWEE